MATGFAALVLLLLFYVYMFSDTFNKQHIPNSIYLILTKHRKGKKEVQSFSFSFLTQCTSTSNMCQSISLLHSPFSFAITQKLSQHYYSVIYQFTLQTKGQILRIHCFASSTTTSRYHPERKDILGLILIYNKDSLHCSSECKCNFGQCKVLFTWPEQGKSVLI